MRRLIIITVYIGIIIVILIAFLSPFKVSTKENRTSQNIRQLFLTKEWIDSTNNIFYRTESYNPSDIAVIVVDMWDEHWCKSMNKKTAALIPKINRTLDAARELGMKIIYAPSETVDFYDKYPQRQRIKILRKIQPLQVNEFNPPTLPWGRTGGCECGPDRPCQEKPVWTHQNAALTIKDDDLISDKVDEINTFCKLNGIKTLIFVGEASNMCVTWTRSFSVIPMIRYGYETLVVRDLVEAITGNGYDPDRREKDPLFTPEKGADSTLKHIEKYISNTVSANQILLAAGHEPINQPKQVSNRMYTKDFVKHYQPKGPSQSFRQLCYDYNWAGREMVNLPLKFTKADPVAYAELSKKANLDAALVLAVPHPGYTTYRSEFGDMFPGLKKDWFGEVVQELHKRDISALGYITLGANWNFMRAHLGLRSIRSGMGEQGQFGGRGLCLNAPGYLDLAENYTRELLTYYPIDGIRYDFMVTPYGCDCDGCMAFYKSLYHEDFTSWSDIGKTADSSRYYTFNIETLRKAAQRLHDAAKLVKPEVEVWQNHLDPMMSADLNTGRLFDIAYVEYGTPFRLLALKGILDKKEIIVGQTLKSSIRNLILALGARCYQYIKVDQKTTLPVGDELKWVQQDLSHFYATVAEKQPFLNNANLVSDIGILFSENTRYRFKEYDRQPYMAVCEAITNSYLKESVPVTFINALDLEKGRLSDMNILLLPLTTGLTKDELDYVKEYVKKGGNLVIMGDALMYDTDGKQLPDFSLAKESGLSFVRNWNKDKDSLTIFSDGFKEKAGDFTITIPKQGNTLKWATINGIKAPLVHVNDYERGKIMYIASASANKTLLKTTQNQFGSPFIKVSDQKQVILTEQPNQRRWILHLIDDGNYRIRIRKGNVGFTRIQSQYPGSSNWDAVLKEDGAYWNISVEGKEKDRLLILE